MLHGTKHLRDDHHGDDQPHHPSEQRDRDRAWYDDEEGLAVVHDATDGHNPFIGDDALYQKREAAAMQRFTLHNGKELGLAASARARAKERDLQSWEEDRLVASGIARRREKDLAFTEELENTPLLVVHDTRPPFLDWRLVFTKQVRHNKTTTTAKRYTSYK